MIANPLSRNRLPQGSRPRPRTSPTYWNEVRKVRSWRTGRVPAYVRGHLLNARIGGSGSDPRNLTPITSGANRRMYLRMERIVVRGTLGTRPGPRRGKVFDYRVRSVGLGGTGPRSPRRCVEDNGVWHRRLVPEERRLARQLEIVLTQLDFNPTSGHWDRRRRTRSRTIWNTSRFYPRAWADRNRPCVPPQ